MSRQSFTLVDHLLSPLLWHIIVGPGYIDTVNRLIDEFIVRLTWHQHLPPVDVMMFTLRSASTKMPVQTVESR